MMCTNAPPTTTPANTSSHSSGVGGSGSMNHPSSSSRVPTIPKQFHLPQSFSPSTRITTRNNLNSTTTSSSTTLTTTGERGMVNNSSSNNDDISFVQLQKLFSMKEEDASSKLGISKSKLKRIKKKLNIQRWPYRRLQSLEREIASINDMIRKSDGMNELCEALEERIASLRFTIHFITKYPNLICKYDNDAVCSIRKYVEKVQISNLVHPENMELNEFKIPEDLFNKPGMIDAHKPLPPPDPPQIVVQPRPSNYVPVIHHIPQISQPIPASYLPPNHVVTMNTSFYSNGLQRYIPSTDYSVAIGNNASSSYNPNQAQITLCLPMQQQYGNCNQS